MFSCSFLGQPQQFQDETFLFANLSHTPIFFSIWRRSVEKQRTYEQKCKNCYENVQKGSTLRLIRGVPQWNCSLPLPTRLVFKLFFWLTDFLHWTCIYIWRFEGDNQTPRGSSPIKWRLIHTKSKLLNANKLLWKCLPSQPQLFIIFYKMLHNF